MIKDYMLGKKLMLDVISVEGGAIISFIMSNEHMFRSLGIIDGKENITLKVLR